MLSKGLAVAVIILFLGVGIQPAIATNESVKNDTNYYFVNVEFCGLGKEYTVKLTQQQLDELDLFFETIREQLNSAESIEDTIHIYNNAFERLDSLGLLGDYSVNQVQELVTGRFQNSGFSHLINKLSDRLPHDNDFNLFCLISGRTNGTSFLPLSTLIFQRFISIILKLPYLIFYILSSFLNPLFLYNLLRFLISYRIPITLGIGSGISLGFYNAPSYVPANGWINTYGMVGHKNWNDTFYGQISKYYLLYVFLYIGVTGFKGIIIKNTNSLVYYFYYLGFANFVHIGSEPPY